MMKYLRMSDLHNESAWHQSSIRHSSFFLTSKIGVQCSIFGVPLLSSTDYYPFGFQMPGRVYEGDGYRYGFNSMEKDDELKGSGNSYDFGARIYDPRVGRWLAVDANRDASMGVTPYHFVLNSPIRLLDSDGNIQRDCNGQIIATPTGKEETLDGVKFAVYHVYANDGTAIVVYKNLEVIDHPGHTTNCHGTSFLEGKFWLNPDQADLLIKHDGYKKEENPSEIKKGDILLLEHNSINSGGTDHSVTAIENGSDKKTVKTRGKSGKMLGIHTKQAKDQWAPGSSITVLKRTQPDKIVFMNPTVTVTEIPLVTSVPLPNDRPALQGYGVGSSTPAMTTQSTIVTTTQTCRADPKQSKVDTTEKNSSTTPITVP